MPNGWRPTTSEGLLAHLSRELRIEARSRVARIEPLVQDVVDASQAVDNLPPGDVLDTMDPDTIPVTEPGTLPDDIDTSSDPTNLAPNGNFELGTIGDWPTYWKYSWDFGTGEPNPFTLQADPTEAASGSGFGRVDIIAGTWAHSGAAHLWSALPLVPGARYHVSVMVKGQVTGTAYAHLKFLTSNTPETADWFVPGSQTVTIGSITNPTSEYQTITGEIVIPPNHSYGEMVLHTEASVGESGWVIWDNVRLTQLTEGTVPGGVPWYAHPRTRPFDAKEGLYNLTNTSMTPGRLKVVGTKAERNSAILVVGSSTVAGFGSPGVGGWPYRLLQALERDGCQVRGEGPSFVGTARALALAGEPDTRWSFSGTVTQAAASLWASITNGSWAQFNATRQANAVQIHYLHSGGNFSYSINGGAAVAVTTDGTDTQAAVTVAPVTLGLTTVRVTGTSATAAEIVAIDTYRSDLTGLRVIAAGVGGATSANFAFNGFKNNLYTARNTVVPALTLISVGGNDCALAVDLDTFKSNITATVKWSRLGASGVGIVVMPHANTYSLGDWAPYAAALYDVADREDVPLLDMTYRWTDLTTASASGLFGSSFVHPAPNGHADYAHAARRLVY